ncbi:hypothetical protein QLL95_gp0345 [Cotonvirus japonicus]|uniref:Ankyrin repeat protein n=1 Tax=Cotonvirus japonicus TaxID=2811091 RepID=A0ABM7NUB6_9VIRU|nr:hypothetical protein QLL95_gp0345 [Cotonvirus japonicus]BCS83778.1 hypothetical protein [Cotonvirus japonicus]
MFFPFCFTDQHLSKFSDEIIVAQSKIIFTTNHKKITTKYKKINDIFEIQVKMSDAITFMKYIMENYHVFRNNKIHFPEKYFFKYMIFILANNMYPHIKFFNKKFIPLVERKISKYLCLISGILMKIPNNTVISDNTKCYFVSNLDYDSISYYLYHGIRYINIEVFDCLLKLYGKILKKYLTDETYDFLYANQGLISFSGLLKNVMASKKKIFFDRTIEYFSSYFDNINPDKILDKRKKIYYETKQEYQYNDELIKEFLTYSVYSHETSKEIYRDILSDCRDINYLTDFLVLELLRDEYCHSSESFVDWKCYPKYLKSILNEIDKRIGIKQTYIDNLFINSYRNSETIVNILIDYGADYTRLSRKFIKKARFHNKFYSADFLNKLTSKDSIQ